MGPVAEIIGSSSVRPAICASSPPAVSRNQSSRSAVLIMTQYFWSECLYTLPSSTMSPSALTNAPYRTCPAAAPDRSFVNRRWINRPASGPVTSYFTVEKRSQRPVAVRIASYSFWAVSPTVMAQGQPSSQMMLGPGGQLGVVQR